MLYARLEMIGLQEVHPSDSVFQALVAAAAPRQTAVQVEAAGVAAWMRQQC